MKLMINYDFLSRVRDAKEPFGPVKLIRNQKSFYLKFNLPIYIACNMLFFSDVEMLPCLLVEGASTITAQLLYLKMIQIDIYKKIAQDDLKELSSQLKDLGIDTTYDLLLESELYKRKYHIKLNENKIPYLLEHKYILVPTYDYHGEIRATSILQEHVVDSKEYVLSIGSPKKQVQFAYSNV